MNNISVNPSFLLSVEEMVNVILYPCQLLVPTLVLITLIISLIKGFANVRGVEVDYGMVARGFILMGVLFFYQELLGLISGTIGAFAGFLNQPSNIYATLDELASGREQAESQSLLGYAEEVVEFFESFNLLSLLQSFALGGVASIARKLMELFRQTILGFLYITGPIAISLSVLPVFGQLGQKWFQNYLSVQCWSITLIILDNLVVLYRDLTQHQLGLMTGLSVSEAAEKLDMLLITIVIAILYFMVPYLTSLFVGQTQSAIYPAKVVATGAAATILAAKGTAMVSRAGGASAAASGFHSTGPVASGGGRRDEPFSDSGPRDNGRSNSIPVRH